MKITRLELRHLYTMIDSDLNTLMYRLDIGRDEYDEIKQHLVDELNRLRDLYIAVKYGK